MLTRTIGLSLLLAVHTNGLIDFGTTTVAPVLNIFDGPASVSYANTTPTLNKLPTNTTMQYYSYYVGSMYCTNQLSDLSCAFCQNFKNDVTTHTVLQNSTEETCALVTVSDSRQEIVVAYRGTANIWNLVLDFIFFDTSNVANLTGFGNSTIKFHTGFYIATMSLYDNVKSAVGKYLESNPTYKIVITGHSMGGAMARITYLYFSYLGIFPNATYELYTYGEPRVGNKPLADYMNKQSIMSARIVNKADIVAHVPPTSLSGTETLFEFFVHPQNEHWMPSNASPRFCNTSVYEDPSCSDSLGPAYNLYDHQTYFGLNFLSC